MLTDRRSSLSLASSIGILLWWADVDRRVGTLGLEVAWLPYARLGGFKTFEGVRSASLEAAGEADEVRDGSGVVEGPRSFETGN